MKYFYIFPVEAFERNTDDDTIIRAWKDGKAERYTPEYFAALINDESFCPLNYWIRVIDDNEGFFEISRLHRDDLESIGYDTSHVDDSVMNTLASKLGSDYCDQLFWGSLPIIANHLDIPKREDNERL